jgi:uncharacterized membrane protein
MILMEIKETPRIETFSDAIFAIAITLLVLEIKVPEIQAFHSKNDLWHELSKLWTSYFAFLLSFVFILNAWICHHALFNLIVRVSPQFIYANGFLLLNVVFMPFPTATLAKYIISAYTPSAVIFYILCFLVTGISWNLLYYFLLKPTTLVKDKISIDAVKSMHRNAKYGLAINSIIILCAWWFPLTAITINTLLWFFWIKQSSIMLRRSKTSLV